MRVDRVWNRYWGRRFAASVVVATLFLGVATVGLASVPPRPLRSALTVVHTLSFRVATDWLAVVALLAVAERYASADRAVDRRTVRRLAAFVFVGGLAIEASPFVRLVVEPAAVETAVLATGVAEAAQNALFPTGLFLATCVGAVALRDAVGAVEHPAGEARLPLAPTGDWTPTVVPRVVGRAAAVLAGVAAASFAIEVGLRLALGSPYPWLAAVDAGVDALAGLVDHAVLATAFLALAAEGTRLRSVVVGGVGVLAALFVGGLLVTVLAALLAVALVNLTTTPMAAVEGHALGRWPAPPSWQLLLRTGAYLAGAAGLWTVQRADRRRGSPEQTVGATDPDRGTAER